MVKFLGKFLYFEYKCSKSDIKNISTTKQKKSYIKASNTCYYIQLIADYLDFMGRPYISSKMIIITLDQKEF